MFTATDFVNFTNLKFKISENGRFLFYIIPTMLKIEPYHFICQPK